MNSPVHGTTSGIDRRTVLRTGAWAVPAIALAAAAPAASASGGVAFSDLATSWTDTFFDTALTRRYEVSPAGGFQIANAGPEIPAGAVSFTVEFDRFAYQTTQLSNLVTLDFQGVRTDHSPAIIVGERSASITFTIPQAVAAQSADNFVYVNLPFLNTAPNDVYDSYFPKRYTIRHDPGTGVQTTTLGPYAPAVFEAQPWGFDYEVAPMGSFVSGGCTAELPTSAAIRSYGPNPTPDRLQILVEVDDRAVSEVRATIGGATTALVRDAARPTAWLLDLGVVAADYAADLSFDYTIDPAAGFGPVEPRTYAGLASMRTDDEWAPFRMHPDQRLTVIGRAGSPAACA